MKYLKSLTICSFIICSVLNLKAQEITVWDYYGKKNGSDNICGSFGLINNEQAEQIVESILDEFGLPRNFGIVSCPGIANFYAIREGERVYVIYDPEYLEKLDGLADSAENVSTESWVALRILAHEVAHMVSQHLMISKFGKPEFELEADEWSGFVLAKMGASLSDAISGTQIFEEKATYRYPSRKDRIEAIKEGWRKGGGSTTVTNAKKEIAQGKRFYSDKKYKEAYRLLYKHRFDPDFDASSQARLGFMYDSGKGISRDYNEANKWYRKAGENGNTTAIYNYAQNLRQGKGTSVNYTEALKWYLKAAKKDYDKAIFQIGYLHDKGLGINQDYSKANRWYRIAAEKGHIIAMYNYAQNLRQGKGTSVNYSEALKWYRKAAEKGDYDAMAQIGYIFAKGLGVEKDDLEANKWYLKAAKGNNSVSMYNLGQRYRLGKGFEINRSEAIRWYRLAEQNGYEEAKERLKEMGVE